MEGNYLIFVRDGKIYQAGYNIVPTGRVDKVLPVKKHVAMQADKLKYEGETLKIIEGETLMTAEEYEAYEAKNDNELRKQIYGDPEVDELVEPE